MAELNSRILHDAFMIIYYRNREKNRIVCLPFVEVNASLSRYSGKNQRCRK